MSALNRKYLNLHIRSTIERLLLLGLNLDLWTLTVVEEALAPSMMPPSLKSWLIG